MDRDDIVDALLAHAHASGAQHVAHVFYVDRQRPDGEARQLRVEVLEDMTEVNPQVRWSVKAVDASTGKVGIGNPAPSPRDAIATYHWEMFDRGH